MKRPFAAIATSGAVFLLMSTPLPFAAGAEASLDCDSAYDVYSAVSAAAGMQVTTKPGAALPVDEGDGGLPTAQSHVGSLSGSQAFAGAPYSEAAAGNLGVVGGQIGVPLTPNDVPVFSVSKYPTDPHDEKSTPGAAITTSAARQSARAEVVGGVPSAGVASTGRTDVTSTTSCDSGAVMHTVGDNDIDTVTVASVLRIAHVRSHAEAKLGPEGDPKLDGSMQVDGVSVLGQAVGITDQGLVAAGTTVPLPDSSPLVGALGTAGISMRYIAAAKDPKQGSVVAPGLEITVTRDVGSVAGAGKTVTTLTLGQAVASVSRSGDVPAPASVDNAYVPPPASQPAAAVSSAPLTTVVSIPDPVQASAPPTVLGLPKAPTAQRALPVFVRQAFHPWSIERLYVAMAIGMCVLLVPTISIKKVAVIRR